jgi:hypothetical protein
MVGATFTVALCKRGFFIEKQPFSHKGNRKGCPYLKPQNTMLFLGIIQQSIKFSFYGKNKNEFPVDPNPCFIQ